MMTTFESLVAEALVAPTAAYFVWATVISDSLFHRIWSLALGLLEFSVLILPRLWPSWPAYFLILFIIVDFIFCAALSPLQRFIVPVPLQHPTFLSVEEVPPLETEDVNVEHLPILADVVAVHGLGSNPTTTWLSRSASSAGPSVSWLRDLLPRENLKIRILIHNHNTRWDTDAVNKSLHHYGDDLLRGLRRVRQKSEDWQRPLVFIGHSFGGLIIKQMLVNASLNNSDEFCRAVLESTKGFIFLGTPHKGSHLTFSGQVMSLFGHWTGASTSLLEVVRPSSNLNDSLHRNFMHYLREHCGVQNTVCVFETVPEAMFGFPITQVVDRKSAVIDGSHDIGFEEGHRDIQRHASADDKDYKDLVRWIREWTSNEQDVSITSTDAKVLESLAFPEMLHRRNNIDRAHPNTCQWILQNVTYKSWQAQCSGLLWVKGKPGAGKSTLMSFIYNAMKDESGSTPSTRLDFFYNGRGTQLQKSSLGMFRALLNQLYTQCPTIRDPIRKAFEDKQTAYGSGAHQWEWQQQELEGIFLQAATKAAQSRSLVIFVDALDEAGELAARNIADYFHDLNDVQLNITQTKIRICISCRHYPISSTIPGAEIWVENFNGNDITSFMQDKLQIGHLAGERSDERLDWESLVKELTQRAAGVFQWARLVVPMAIKYISDGESPLEIRRRLREVPEKLGAVYEHILEHVIDRRNRPRTLLLLQWVCLASRPLTVTELRFALAATSSMTGAYRLRCQDTEGFVDTDKRMERLIVSLSGGLVETTGDEKGARKGVQVIHQSVNDFLVPQGLTILSTLTGDLDNANCHELLNSEPFHMVHRSHGVLFRACLNYIILEEVQFEQNRYGDEVVRLPTPFLGYATTQLFQHAEQSNEHYFLKQDFPLRLNELQDILPKWVRLFRSIYWWNRRRPAKDTTILHVACQFNLSDIITELLQRGTNLELKDDNGYRALHFAAMNGHIDKVRVLLTAGAKIEPKAQDGQTPLVSAARSGHGDIVRLLVASGGQINQMTGDSGNTLQQAAKTGNVALALFLITAGAEVNAQGGEYGNALQAASYRGHEQVVRLLLEKGAEVNAQGGLYGNALQAASHNGHEQVVRLLIEKGAEVNAQGGPYGNALQAASATSHEMIVQILLEVGADVSAAGGLYGDALGAALCQSSVDVVKSLLRHGAQPFDSVYELSKLLLGDEKNWLRESHFCALSRSLILLGLSDDARFCSEQHSAYCDICESTITGTYFVCTTCGIVDLCASCKQKQSKGLELHSCQNHEFLKINCMELVEEDGVVEEEVEEDGVVEEEVEEDEVEEEEVEEDEVEEEEVEEEEVEEEDSMYNPLSEQMREWLGDLIYRCQKGTLVHKLSRQDK